MKLSSIQSTRRTVLHIFGNCCNVILVTSVCVSNYLCDAGQTGEWSRQVTVRTFVILLVMVGMLVFLV